MKNRKQIEKIGVVALAGLCVFLIFKLVSEIMGNPTPDTKPAAAVSTPSQKPAIRAQNSAKGAKGSASSNSTLEMQSLDKYQSKPLPDLGRNPFDFGPPPLTPAQKAAQAAQAARGMGGAMTASSGPAPPNMPLRAIGYSERTGVGPEAYLADADNVFVVHDGDVVSKRFKVLSITSMTVEIQDGASGEKAQLPIPVVQ
jgi:hypothetical protein